MPAYSLQYQLQWWHKQLGSYGLSDLTPPLIAQCRDPLAEMRSPASVRAYLSAFSHVLTIASSEWNWLEGFTHAQGQGASWTPRKSQIPVGG